jgi:hypothetical protein
LSIGTPSRSHSALLVKVFGDVQFARRLAEPRDDQDQRRQRPGNMLLSRRQRAFQKRVQSELLDEFQRQPRTAELPAVLDPDARAIDLDEARFGSGLREQVALPRGRMGIGSLLHAQPAGLVHQAQVGHRTLPWPLLCAIRFDQRPIRFTLTVAPAVMGSQKHAPMLATIRNAVFHYTPTPTKYLPAFPTNRRHITTYVTTKFGKIIAQANSVRRLGKLG